MASGAPFGRRPFPGHTLSLSISLTLNRLSCETTPVVS